MPFLNNKDTTNVQKYICKDCNMSFNSSEQRKNILIRNSIKNTIIRLITVLRFGHGMSVRGISDVISNVYGFCSSIGFIDKVCQQVANNAKISMDKLNQCNQKMSKVLMYDETFPKSKGEGCINLGVATCENGLIRKIQPIDVSQKSNQTNLFFKSIITTAYKPSIFISDYDNIYPVEIRKIISDIFLLKDFVHTVRNIYKDSKSAINKVRVKFSEVKITKEKQKKITNLKKKLLKKQLNKILSKMRKGFNKRYCPVGALYIEGNLEDLRLLSEKFPSLEPFYKKLNKFIKKNIATWNDHMELYYREGIPLTSNIVESKNGILKAFSKKAKSYSRECIEKFFCAVALYENFSIKTRGVNKGTNAMERADINLTEFGATNFFEAVGISSMTNCDEYSQLRLDIK